MLLVWSSGPDIRHQKERKVVMVLSPFGSRRATIRGHAPVMVLPTRPSGWPVAAFPNYAEAQQAVDYMADRQFPVDQMTIVGVDLMQVERVAGRLTWPKVLGVGAVSGAWLGLLVGLVVSIFAVDPVPSVLAGVLAGVTFGVITAAIPYGITRDATDFSSTSQLVAVRYDVLCDPRSGERAGDMPAHFHDASAGGSGGVRHPTTTAGRPAAGA